MDDLEYEVLSWLAAGNSVFRPREATQEAEEAFRGVVALLARLRDRGLVSYLDGHITQTGSGILPDGRPGAAHARRQIRTRPRMPSTQAAVAL